MTAQKPKQHQKPKKKPKNVKKAETELAAKYTYRITWSEEDGEYVGLCAEFPSLSWLASTRDMALHGIERMVGDVLRDMAKADEPIPNRLPRGDTAESSSFAYHPKCTDGSPSRRQSKT